MGERRSSVVDAPYAEAGQVLSQAAERIHSIAQGIRQDHTAELGASASSDADLALVDQALARLEVVARDLADATRFLDQGGHSRPGGPAARQILEAQEHERSRLAEELHDGPAQALSNAGFQVEVIDRALRSDAKVAKRELANLRRLLERELMRMRDFIHQLRPALDESGGLDTAIEELAETVRSETGMEVVLDLGASEEWLDLAARTAVLRITQEALRNARKHAGARCVRVLTRVETAPGEPTPSAWILEVRDDGRGFPPEQASDRSPRRHFGLRFMRERAQLVGACLAIESAAGGGTTVRLVLGPRERS